ncbi:MAG TPA: metalloregulator ArsR/SmtB family transcription factor [Candidatus Dormibacteraeota bacterium]
MATTERTLSAPPTARVKGCCVPLAPLLAGSTADEIAAVHRALADPTRVQMLHLLKASSQPICVCDFTSTFDLGQPTVSHHLGRLRAAGFVDSHREGIWAFYRLREDMPTAARAALSLIP